MLNGSIARKLILFGALLVPLTAFSEEQSELERFEKDATLPRKVQESESRSRQPPARKAKDNDGDTSGGYSQDLENQLISSVAEIVVDIVSYPGIYSWRRVTPSTSYNISDENPATPRGLGEAVIPFARIDVSYNRINSHISATSERAEIGYGPFGFEVRNAHYTDTSPEASLNVMQYHVLYRMSLDDDIEMDFGLGEYKLTGVSSNSGSSSTIHILVYPTERFGIEFRPSWATINGNGIRDHELAINYGDKFWSARAGYHWLESPAASLSGPFVGLSLRL